MMLCFTDDIYVREQQLNGGAIWLAELSNGYVVRQDDDRPGALPKSAWLRLAQYVEEQNLSIRKLWLKFRSQVKSDILPENADGYFFCKSVLGSFGCRQNMHFYLIGALQDQKIMVQKWYVPSLIKLETEEREVTSAGICLIRNKNGKSLEDRPG